ncbi:MAG: Holliday junction branch migration protein RuvA [Acidobacteria bacterium]|nr:MAG: Holliday junction branch migration protein RuvA [Acidobacteriota bacterium]
MIGYIFGKVKSVYDPYVLLLNNGVGYEIYCGSPEKKCQVGTEMEFWIHTYVREDQLKLFGFRSYESKSLFLILNGISGVGPKTAYAIVELFTPVQMMEVVARNDVMALQTVPGIGKKTAGRLMLELDSKLKKIKTLPGFKGSSMAAAGIWADLRAGLLSLGFPEIKINRVIQVLKREKKEWTLEVLMENALRKINQ